jgi:hypothetical protein
MTDQPDKAPPIRLEKTKFRLRHYGDFTLDFVSFLAVPDFRSGPPPLIPPEASMLRPLPAEHSVFLKNLFSCYDRWKKENPDTDREPVIRLANTLDIFNTNPALSAFVSEHVITALDYIRRFTKFNVRVHTGLPPSPSAHEMRAVLRMLGRRLSVGASSCPDANTNRMLLLHAVEFGCQAHMVVRASDRDSMFRCVGTIFVEARKVAVDSGLAIPFSGRLLAVVDAHARLSAQNPDSVVFPVIDSALAVAFVIRQAATVLAEHKRTSPITEEKLLREFVGRHIGSVPEWRPQ